MTKMNFDDIWEHAWRQAKPDADRSKASKPDAPISGNLSSAYAELDPEGFAALSPDEQADLAEWANLQEALLDRPAPMPSVDFTERVLANLEEDHSVASQSLSEALKQDARERTPSHKSWWMGSIGVFAAAAALFLALRWWADESNDFGPVSPPGAGPVAVNTPRDDNPSPAKLREGLAVSGQQYFGMVQEMTAVFATSTDDEAYPVESVSNVDPNSDLDPDDPMSMLPAPPVDRLWNDSTVSVASAGREIEIGLRPIKQSAVGAFGFLLPVEAAPEQEQ